MRWLRSMNESTPSSDIDASNFNQETINQVSVSISEADFIAIDTEMSGLIPLGGHLEYYDNLNERYLKIKQSAENFAVLQFGICTFKWIDDKYTATPYNFYLFQSISDNLSHDLKPAKAILEKRHNFLCQSSSLSFLADNGFDLMRCITQGIPYMNHDLERSVRNASNLVSNDTIEVVSKDDTEFVENALTEIRLWLQNSSIPKITIDTPTSFHRRLVHQEVKAVFNGFLKTEGRSTCVEITKLTVEERSKCDAKAKIENDINSMIGFRKIIDIIVKSKKAIIGHNMFLDLLHTVHHFCQDLPEDYVEFKTIASSLFPQIYDTKYICASALSAHIPQTALNQALEKVSESPFINPVIDSPYSGEVSFHDAAYDAFATGQVFLRSVSHMLNVGIEAEGNKRLDMKDPKLVGMNGKLFIMRSDIGCFDLISEAEILPDRSNVFFLREFSSSITQKDIQKIFRPFSSVSVRWKDSESCFVMVRDASKVIDIEERFRIGRFTDNVPEDSEVEVEASPFDFVTETWKEYEDRVFGSLPEGGIGRKRKREDEETTPE